jgi:carbon-monoxide dehydrogenase iron sulfur subunit
MKKLLFAKPDLCSGCGRCTYACSAVKEGLFQPSKSRVQINNFSLRGYSVPSICFQCPGAACQKACPVEAISRDENDVVVVDAEKCNGCGLCVAACPYGLIEQGTTGLAYKCDNCGGDPACVKECQPGALVYQEQDKEIVKVKVLQMKQRSTSGIPEQKRHALGLAVLKVGREE